jgi:hypothetical protein
LAACPRFWPATFSSSELTLTNGVIQQMTFRPLLCRNCIISVGEANPG